jgi:hypothetical protein
LPRDQDKKRARMRGLLESDLRSEALPPIERCFLALEHYAIDEDDRGDAELAKALADDARCEPIVTLVRAQRHRAHGRFAEAAAAARHALALPSTRFRGRTSAHAVLADALDRAGDPRGAIEATRAAIAEEPDVASHRVNLAALTGDESELGVARRLNPWLDDPRIHRPGARPSIFVQQDAILARVTKSG